MAQGVRNLLPARIILGLTALQIIFSIVVAAVTGTKLSYGDLCQLNVNPTTGRVCDFVYPTVGFSLAVNLGIIVGTVYVLRKTTSGPVTRAGTTGSAVYEFIWWLVFSITISIRGQQATDAGQPGTVDRNAVVGLSWIITVAFLAIAIISIWEKRLNKEPQSELEKSFILKKDSGPSVDDRASSGTSGSAPKPEAASSSPAK